MNNEERRECPVCKGWIYTGYLDDTFCQNCCGSGVIPADHFYSIWESKCLRCGKELVAK